MLSHTTPAPGPGLDLRLLRAPSFSDMAAQDPAARITLEMVARITRLSTRTIYRLTENAGAGFPRPVEGAGGRLFVAGEVHAWMQAQTMKRRAA